MYKSTVLLSVLGLSLYGCATAGEDHGPNAPGAEMHYQQEKVIDSGATHNGRFGVTPPAPNTPYDNGTAGQGANLNTNGSAASGYGSVTNDNTGVTHTSGAASSLDSGASSTVNGVRGAGTGANQTGGANTTGTNTNGTAGNNTNAPAGTTGR